MGKMRNELEVRRLLRMRDYEVYRIIERPGYEAFAYLLILDMRRPSTLDDFPWIPPLEEGSNLGIGRGNLIRCIMIHHDELDEPTAQDIKYAAICLSEQPEDCDWTYYVEKVESKEEFARIEYDLLHAFDGILEKHQFSVDVSGITEESFKYLSQD